MARIIREEIVPDVEPVTTRVVTEQRTVSGSGASFGLGTNPLAMVIAALLVAFILVLVFGFMV